MADFSAKGIAQELRVMTYNVHRCRGLDRQWSPERIAEVIAEARPDVVALQELDVGRARSGSVDQAEMIARALGMDVQFFPVLRIMEELYGDAILSRLPSRLIKAGGLPALRGVPGLEPRGALWSSIRAGAIEVQVINTHLGLLARERAKQVTVLLGPEWLGHPDCRRPVILAGDFNATSRSRSYRRLAARFTDAQLAPGTSRPRATFPARYPALRIDHVFVDPAIEVLAAQTVRTPLALIASDHLPVVVHLCLRAEKTLRPSGRRQHDAVVAGRQS
jgi:endonuclease/exonuclease/phosphatase family metal-dependent hydrolase